MNNKYKTICYFVDYGYEISFVRVNLYNGYDIMINFSEDNSNFYAILKQIASDFRVNDGDRKSKLYKIYFQTDDHILKTPFCHELSDIKIDLIIDKNDNIIYQNTI